jgi:hypothetical protein
MVRRQIGAKRFDLAAGRQLRSRWFALFASISAGAAMLGIGGGNWGWLGRDNDNAANGSANNDFFNSFLPEHLWRACARRRCL